MADFRMPLETIYLFFRECHCFNTANIRTGKNAKPFGNLTDLIRMGSPDRNIPGVPFQDIIVFADMDIPQNRIPRIFPTCTSPPNFFAII